MKKIAICILLIFGSKVALTQNINLFVKEIKEERHSDQNDNFIELTTLVNGVKIDDEHKIVIKKITKAIDNKGNSLKKIEDFFGDDYSSNSEIKIKLEAPQRSSTRIVTVEGVLKYFTPSETNNSIVIIQNPLNQFNSNLLEKHSSNVKLTLIDKESLEKLKEEDENEYKKKIEKLKADGVIKEEEAETIDVFKQFFEGFSNFGGSKESLTFYVQDAKDEIIDILIYNNQGEKMNYGRSQMNNKLTISLREMPKDDWKIKIVIENIESVKELNFKLTDIILP